MRYTGSTEQAQHLGLPSLLPNQCGRAVSNSTASPVAQDEVVILAEHQAHPAQQVEEPLVAVVGAQVRDRLLCGRDDDLPRLDAAGAGERQDGSALSRRRGFRRIRGSATSGAPTRSSSRHSVGLREGQQGLRLGAPSARSPAATACVLEMPVRSASSVRVPRVGSDPPESRTDLRAGLWPRRPSGRSRRSIAAAVPGFGNILWGCTEAGALWAHMSEFDDVVIGGGAAGLSAALVLSRARRTVLVVDSGSPATPPLPTCRGSSPGTACPPASCWRRPRGGEAVRRRGTGRHRHRRRALPHGRVPGPVRRRRP